MFKKQQRACCKMLFCHCEPVRRLVWQSVFPVIGVRILTPVCALAQNDKFFCILQQARYDVNFCCAVRCIVPGDSHVTSFLGMTEGEAPAFIAAAFLDDGFRAGQ